MTTTSATDLEVDLLRARVESLERTVAALVAAHRAALIKPAKARALDDRILLAVGDEFAVSPAAIMGRRRDAHIVIARHVAIYLTRKWTGLSYPVLACFIVALSAFRSGARVMACLSGEPGKSIQTEGFRRDREPLNIFETGLEFEGSPLFDIYKAGCEELCFQVLGSTEVDETFTNDTDEELEVVRAACRAEGVAAESPSAAFAAARASPPSIEPSALPSASKKLSMYM